MERTTYKAINFDLDTKAMKEYGVLPNGYKSVGTSLSKYGFSHRQGSGYISNEKIKDADALDAIIKTTKENPWLGDCVKKIDVTNVGRQFDLTDAVKFSSKMATARAASNNTQKNIRVNDSKTKKKDSQNFME